MGTSAFLSLAPQLCCVNINFELREECAKSFSGPLRTPRSRVFGIEKNHPGWPGARIGLLATFARPVCSTKNEQAMSNFEAHANQKFWAETEFGQVDVPWPRWRPGALSKFPANSHELFPASELIERWRALPVHLAVRRHSSHLFECPDRAGDLLTLLLGSLAAGTFRGIEGAGLIPRNPRKYLIKCPF